MREPCHPGAATRRLLAGVSGDAAIAGHPLAGHIIFRKIGMFRIIAITTLALAAHSHAATPQSAVLDVKNMTCSLCPITAKTSLQKPPCVAEAKIDFDKETATVKFDADKVTPLALAKATTDAGYPSSVRK